MRITYLAPLSGAPFWACGACGSVRTARYCSVCGEKVPRERERWLTLSATPGEATARKGRQILDSWPGRAQIEPDRWGLHVERASDLQWLADKGGSLPGMRQAVMTGASGWELAADDPIFACLLGTVDSSIRGCMTQKARASACGELASLLPLCEKMTTYSLADLLELAGRKKEAELLTLGVILQMERGDARRSCPLFGRALRLGPADVDRMHLLFSLLEGKEEEGPVVAGSGRPKLRRGGGLVGTTVSGIGGRALAVEAGPQSLLCHSGRQIMCASVSKRNRTGLSLYSESGDLLSRCQASGEVDFVHPADGVFVAGVRRSRGLRGVHLVQGDADSEVSVSATLPVCDLSRWNGVTACVEVYGATVRVASADEKGDLRLAAWRGRMLSGTRWMLHVVGTRRFLIWSDAGAMALLGPGKGWLLTPASGDARYPDQRIDAPHFNRVRHVLRLSQRTFAVLADGGHSVSLLTVQDGPGTLEVPASCDRRLILPVPAAELSGDGGDLLFLRDQMRLYSMRVSTGEARHWQPLGDDAGGRVMVGGGWHYRGPVPHLVLPGRASSSRGWLLDVSEKLADLLGQKHGETHRIVDRLGRRPDKSSWGV
jgi:hypothetical protein